VRVLKVEELEVGERYSFEEGCSINSNFIVIWKDETKVRIKYVNLDFGGIIYISGDTNKNFKFYEFPLIGLEKELL
jgi:hypothetical protein